MKLDQPLGKAVEARGRASRATSWLQAEVAFRSQIA
jgi:hypothetical protein